MESSRNTSGSLEAAAPLRLVPDEKKDFTLDGLLVHLGEFGRFQRIVLAFTCLPALFMAFSTVSYVFTAAKVTHRCQIAECDAPQSAYEEPWTHFAIPSNGEQLDQCQRYAHIDNILGKQCHANNFNTSHITPCPNNSFIFRNEERTISNDFGIYCADAWKLTAVGLFNNLGQFVGIPVGGFISDNYGRRTALAFCGFFSAIFGLIRAFTKSYAPFLVFEFLDNVACSSVYAICFIIGIELVGPRRRVFTCGIITASYAIGEVLLGVTAKFYTDWRIMLRILYLPGLALIALLWALPESVRWLLSQGRSEDAKDILQRAAAMNRRKLSETLLDELLLANSEKLREQTDGRFPLKQAFGKLFGRIVNCSFCWIVTVMVYYGLSLNSVLLRGDKYNNFILMALVEIPGFFIPCVTLDRFGRRYSLCGFLLLSGLCCLGTALMPDAQYYLQIGLFLIGKLAITAVLQTLCFFTSELFPTNLRNSLMSFCVMMGRFGYMVATQTPLLAKYNANAPAVLFAFAALISGGFSLIFPETLNTILPATLTEADNIGAKKSVNNASNGTIVIQDECTHL